MRRSVQICALVLTATATHASDAEPDLRLIIDRQETSIEVFSALDVDRLTGLFGTDPNGLAAEDGRVYYGEFRKSGTYDFASDMISKVSMMVGGVDAELDAMSVMVHPQTLTMPYETPFDAVLAMAVCNVNDPLVPPAIEDLQLYSGFVAYPVDGWDVFSLHLPTTEPITVEITTYVDNEFTDAISIELRPGAPIDFAAAEKTGWFWGLGLAGLLAD